MLSCKNRQYFFLRRGDVARANLLRSGLVGLLRAWSSVRLADIVVDAGFRTEIEDESATEPWSLLCHVLKTLLESFEISTIVSRGILDESFPALWIRQSGFSNALKNLVFGFYCHDWVPKEAIHCILHDCVGCKSR